MAGGDRREIVGRRPTEGRIEFEKRNRVNVAGAEMRYAPSGATVSRGRGRMGGPLDVLRQAERAYADAGARERVTGEVLAA
ncbi:hypothetical protein AEGHOMDF_3333 [Methylobacterium soli]|nr:hypothetical protein AEGHOMDF_3333 [Methylobacterium soli]